MLEPSQDNLWVIRTKWLTQALIISGTLNIGLISTFVYFALKDKQTLFSVEHTPLERSAKEALPTCSELIVSYSLLSFQELILYLDNREHVEAGLKRRDLALACLVAFHHFNLEKALGSLPLQKRILPLIHDEGQEVIDIPVFPGLAEEQFQAIAHFAKTEKWPLTSQGLFYELKRMSPPYDPSLLEAFRLCPEYDAIYTLLTATGIKLSHEQVVNLVLEGDWKILSALAVEQRTPSDLQKEHRRHVLIQYFESHCKIASQLLLESDPEFVLKRFEDGQILTLLDLCDETTTGLEHFLKALLLSPRSDSVWKRAAKTLYSLSSEQIQEPYDHALALQRFCPETQKKAPQAPPPAAIAPLPKRIVHTVAAGENLWKIARKYKVPIQEIMRLNRLETEKIRPGKQLEIPNQSAAYVGN